MEIFHNDWAELLNPELKKPYYRKLRQFLIGEYRTHHVYPDMYSIFNALHYTSYADTKVVILGQDPYHGPGQAHGLSFSVLPGVQPPPSLLNIFKELETDLGCKVPNNGCLKPWADQGVLLLNTVLTVREHQRIRITVRAGKSLRTASSNYSMSARSRWHLFYGGARLDARRR